MPTNISASVTIQRLRSGQTVFLSLASDRALFQTTKQGVGSLACSPDWTDSAFSPTITPSITTLGQAITQSSTVAKLVAARWRYNGHIFYDSANSSTTLSGWTIGTGNDFTINTAGGVFALTITRNIALDSSGQPRTAHDVFTYEADVEVEGVTQTVKKDIVATIQQLGDGGYYVQLSPICTLGATGFPGTSTAQLSAEGATAIEITPTVLDNEGVVQTSGFTLKWFAGSTSTAAISTASTLTVARDAGNGYQVDGAVIILCQAIGTNGNILDTGGITIVDVSDPYTIDVGGDTNIPSGTSGGIVKAKLCNPTSGDLYIGQVQWSATLNHPDDLTPLAAFGTKTSTNVQSLASPNPFEITIKWDHLVDGSGNELQTAFLFLSATIA